MMRHVQYCTYTHRILPNQLNKRCEYESIWATGAAHTERVDTMLNKMWEQEQVQEQSSVCVCVCLRTTNIVKTLQVMARALAINT